MTLTGFEAIDVLRQATLKLATLQGRMEGRTEALREVVGVLRTPNLTIEQVRELADLWDSFSGCTTIR